MTVAERKPRPKSADWPARIRRLKARLDLNNTGLAERMGVSVETVRSWLYRHQIPSEMAQAFIAELEKNN